MFDPKLKNSHVLLVVVALAILLLCEPRAAQASGGDKNEPIHSAQTEQAAPPRLPELRHDCYISRSAISIVEPTAVLRAKANKGDATAEYALSKSYFSARSGSYNTDVSYVEAKKLLEAAANRNQDEAQYSLATLYYEGELEARDYQEADFWARLSIWNDPRPFSVPSCMYLYPKEESEKHMSAEQVAVVVERVTKWQKAHPVHLYKKQTEQGLYIKKSAR